jgi:hypothetical protein
VHGQLESVNVIRLSHGLQPFRHPLRVAMLTARADFRATSKRIPSGFGPFDTGGMHFIPCWQGRVRRRTKMRITFT